MKSVSARSPLASFEKKYEEHSNKNARICQLDCGAMWAHYLSRGQIARQADSWPKKNQNLFFVYKANRRIFKRISSPNLISQIILKRCYKCSSSNTLETLEKTLMTHSLFNKDVTLAEIALQLN